MFWAPPAGRDVKMKVRHALPGIGATGVQDHDPGGAERGLHRAAHARHQRHGRGQVSPGGASITPRLCAVDMTSVWPGASSPPGRGGNAAARSSRASQGTSPASMRSQNVQLMRYPIRLVSLSAASAGDQPGDFGQRSAQAAWDPVLQVLGAGREREVESCQHGRPANSSCRQCRRGPTPLAVPIRAAANASREWVIELAGMSSELRWMWVERYRAEVALPVGQL